MSFKDPKEIRIPVPWGHVAAKAWGDEKNRIVLTFHGLFDNAGSFDGLIPLLPNSFYYVCIDLPGHVLYPHLVDKLIMLDTIAPLPVQPEDFKMYLVDKLDGFQKFEQKSNLKTEPTYTYEEAFDKIQSRRNYGIILSTRAANGLMQRAVEPVKDGRYRFTFDQRMKHWINPLSDLRYISEVMENHPIRCPVLIILGSESTVQRMYMKPVLDVLKNWNKATVKIVNGNHDVHNDHPENVAPHIGVFLLNENAKL